MKPCVVAGCNLPQSKCRCVEIHGTDHTPAWTVAKGLRRMYCVQHQEQNSERKVPVGPKRPSGFAQGLRFGSSAPKCRVGVVDNGLRCALSRVARSAKRVPILRNRSARETETMSTTSNQSSERQDIQLTHCVCAQDMLQVSALWNSSFLVFLRSNRSAAPAAAARQKAGRVLTSALQTAMCSARNTSVRSWEGRATTTSGEQRDRKPA